MRARSVDRLFARFRRTGDPAALAKVFDATVAELHKVALYLTGDPHAADDVVQETFVAAIEAAGDHDPSRPVLPWLLGVLANRARVHRRRLVRPLDAARVLRDDAPSAHDEAARRELETELQKALDNLAPPYREVMVLYVRQGMSAKDIADVLGRPAGTVRTQVVRGTELLRKAVPTGFAASAMCVAARAEVSPRVRAFVLGRAVAVAPAAPAAGFAVLASLGTVGGTLVMKKVLVSAAAAAAIAGLAWMVWSPPGILDAPAAPPTSPTAQRSAHAQPADPSREPDAERSPVATTPSDGDASGSLDLEIVWRDDGSPAAGVRLRMQRRDLGSRSRFETVAELRTDGAGRVVCDEFAAGEYEMMWSGPGQRFDITEGAVVHRRIELDPHVRVAGRVLDGDGEPVAGAAVWMAYLSDPEDLEPQLVATSDPHGRFVARRDRLGGIWATSPRRASSDLVHVDGHTQLDLRLEGPGRRLSGTVVDAIGRAVSAAHVAVLPRRRLQVEQRPPLRLRTDARGAFATDELGPGEHMVVAWADGRTPGYAFVDADDAEPTGTYRTEIRMPVGASLQGIVRQGGEPAMVEVACWPACASDFPPSSHHLVASAQSRTDGSYSIARIPPGSIEARAMPRRGRSVKQTFELVDAQTTRWDPQLEASNSIAGRLVDANDTGLPGWSVWASHRTPEQSFSRSAITKSDGAFVIDDLTPGVAYRLAARPHDRHGTGWTHDLEAPAGAEQVRLVAARSVDHVGTLAGRVVDHDGAAAREARVTIRNEHGYSHWQLGSRFSFRVAPGQWSVTVRYCDGHGIDVGEHVVAARAIVDVGIVRPPKLGRLEIRLRGPDGRIHEPTQLQVTGRLGRSDGFERIDDGARRTRPLAVGTYTIWARGETFQPLFQNVDLGPQGDTMIDLPVVPATPVRFTFPRPGAGPLRWVASVSTEIQDTHGEHVPVGSPAGLEGEDEATWTIGLAPGRYSYRFGVDGRTAGGRIEVPAPASPTPIEVRVEYDERR